MEPRSSSSSSSSENSDTFPKKAVALEINFDDPCDKIDSKEIV